MNRFLGFFLLLTLPSVSIAQNETISNLIRDRLDALTTTEELLIQDARIASHEVLPELYQRNQYQLLWQNPAAIDDLFTAIREAKFDGLDPDDYHIGQLETMRAQLARDQASNPGLHVDYDIVLTDSVIRLGYHVVFGKVNPQDLDPNWNLEELLNDIDPVAAFASAISSGEIRASLDKRRPRYRTYNILRKTLLQYRAIEENGGWPRISEGPTLRNGMRDERVRALRERLTLVGDLDVIASDPTLFDDELEDAVKRYQTRNYLDVDGAVGPATLRSLNVPVSQRLAQLRINLERARWIMPSMKDTFVLVDIAGFNVMYWRDGEIVWQSRAQVGKPYRKTPVFASKIDHLVFNPTWTVPPTILRNDILPAVKRDPGYLQKKNIRLFDRQWREVNPDTVDWANVSPNRIPYIFRQDPGPKNALGRVKFMFPNGFAVYLHDTPSKPLFNRTQRAFSSGCIRVENPFELAELLLDDPRNWDQLAMRDVLDSEKLKRVDLAQPIPVLLMYWTVVANDDGTVGFKEDIYDRDPPVLAALEEHFRFHKRPVIGLENSAM